MWKIKAGVFAAIIAIVLAIILWDSGSTEREAKAAFATRLGREPSLSVDQQYHRGILCGSYRVEDRSQGRFVYISHYSAEPLTLQGLHLATDNGFQAVAARLCR